MCSTKVPKYSTLPVGKLIRYCRVVPLLLDRHDLIQFFKYSIGYVMTRNRLHLMKDFFISEELEKVQAFLFDERTFPEGVMIQDGISNPTRPQLTRNDVPGSLLELIGDRIKVRYESIDRKRKEELRIFSSVLDTHGKITIWRAFINKYDSKHGHPLLADGGNQMHLDSSEDHTIMTACITMKSIDCEGGQLKFINSERGSYNPLQRLRHSVDYDLPNNSLYLFPGSSVTHGVRPVQAGTRFAIVLFLKSVYTSPGMYYLYWNPHKRYCCGVCFQLYSTHQTFLRHKKNQRKKRKEEGTEGAELKNCGAEDNLAVTLPRTERHRSVSVKADLLPLKTPKVKTATAHCGSNSVTTVLCL